MPLQLLEFKIHKFDKSIVMIHMKICFNIFSTAAKLSEWADAKGTGIFFSFNFCIFNSIFARAVTKHLIICEFLISIFFKTIHETSYCFFGPGSLLPWEQLCCLWNQGCHCQPHLYVMMMMMKTNAMVMMVMMTMMMVIISHEYKFGFCSKWQIA